MKEFMSGLKSTSENLKLVIRPQFYKISIQSDKDKFCELLATTPFLTDDIHGQLRELIRSRNPGKQLSAQDYEHAIDEQLEGLTMDEYGIWVYYPWSRRLVHLINEDEFIELRTSRNKYKITDSEEALLATKKVGVVGLSVGQSVTMTLCTERGIGEIRIADFDTLELTNLNRIRSGVHNLGVLKTVMVAREIAEIDPFIKVVPFHEGLTPDNMDAFFTGGGKLDLVIDECDGLDIKILLRQKAKSLQIPVLMEASDRGTLDVERFDLEPERSLLHGFIDHLDSSKIGSLTNEEKLPFILPMLGLETISPRLKASMIEMGQTLVTWPQLASAVTLGGALCADVCRRVLLGQFKSSGRYFVDIEELIGDQETKPEAAIQPETSQHRAAVTAAVAQLDWPASGINASELHLLVQAAALAPFSKGRAGGTWFTNGGHLFLARPQSNNIESLDQGGTMADISLGAALEHISLKASALGYNALLVHLANNPSGMIMGFRLSKQDSGADLSDATLVAVIPMKVVPAQSSGQLSINQDDLQKAFQGKGTTVLSLVDDRAAIRAFAQIIGRTNRLLLAHPATFQAFLGDDFYRQKNHTALFDNRADFHTFMGTPKDELTLKIAGDPKVMSLLNQWEMGTALESLGVDRVAQSSMIGLVSTDDSTGAGAIESGRQIDRLWLTCTKLGLRLDPLSALLYFHKTLTREPAHPFGQEIKQMITQNFEELVSLFPALESREGVLLFRLVPGNTERVEPPPSSTDTSLSEL